MSSQAQGPIRGQKMPNAIDPSAPSVPNINNAAPKASKLFSNQLPGQLKDELATAKAKGVSPIKIGDEGFDDIINQGTIKYVVTDSGDVLVQPKFAADGTEISHAVLNSGKPVASAGEADIAGNTIDGYFGTDLSTWSGHYLNGASSTENAQALGIAKDAFSKNGITFPGN
jgi:hypothetical protein